MWSEVIVLQQCVPTMIQFQIIVKRGSAMGIYVVAQIYMFQQ
jgi:hypothetical protein